MTVGRVGGLLNEKATMEPRPKLGEGGGLRTESLMLRKEQVKRP